MSETHASTEDHYEPGLYEIRIKGHLEDRWADWFGGLTITLEDKGDTLLTCAVVDQAALHGLLKPARSEKFEMVDEAEQYGRDFGDGLEHDALTS